MRLEGAMRSRSDQGLGEGKAGPTECKARGRRMWGFKPARQESAFVMGSDKILGMIDLLIIVVDEGHEHQQH